MTNSVKNTARNVVAGLTMAAACALTAAPAHAAGEKIVAIFTSLSEPFFIAMNVAFQDEAKKLDVKAIVFDGQASSPKQTADLNNALVQGAQGIIIAPNNVKALAPAIDEAIKANVPIVTVDRRIEGTLKPVPHFGADNVAGGCTMAEWVIAKFPNGANVVHLTGQPGSSSAIDRAKGTVDCLKKGGDKYKIVAEQTANWQRAQGKSVTEGILTSLTGNPPNVIIGSNDDMALGAVEAVHTSGLDDAGIKILGFDATPDAMKKVKEGKMAATVEQSPSNQIRTALRAVVENIRNKKAIESASLKPFLIEANSIDKADRAAEVK